MSKPRTQKSLFFRLVDGLSELSGYVSGLLILAAMLVICYGVVLRYVLGASTVWQTELAVYFLMFAAFVGGAYGLKHGHHVSIDLLVNRFSGRSQIAVRLLAAVVGLVFIVLIDVISILLWWQTTVEGRHSGTAWNPPLSLPYFILPLGMTLISLQYLAIAAELVQRLRFGESEDDARDENEDETEVSAKGGALR